MSELPLSWIHLKLGDAIDYAITSKVEPSEITEDTWVLELEDIEKESSKLLKKILFSERKSKSTKNNFNEGDVLYGKLRPYLDKVIIADEAGCCTTEIIPIKSGKNIDNRFLFYSLKRKEFLDYVSEVSHGLSMPRLGTKQGREAPFVLVSLNEQIRIANKLDSLLVKVDAAQTRLEKIPTLLKRFRQSVLTKAMSGQLTEGWRKVTRIKWPEKPRSLGDLITLAYGKSLPAKNRSGNGFPVYGSNGQVGRHEKTLVDGPFIIVGRKGSYGEVTWSDDDGWPIDTTYFVQFKVKPNLRFVYFLLQTLGLNQLNRSTAIPGLNRDDAYQKEIIIPDLIEQKEIVRRVESLFSLADSVEKQYTEAKRRLDRLTQSLLAKAFRGELVPQDPNDEPASELLKRIQVEREGLKPVKKTRQKKA